MSKIKKKYGVRGVINTAIPHYINLKVLAYSSKQARLKAFFMLKQKSYFSGMPNKNLMGRVKKLHVVEE